MKRRRHATHVSRPRHPVTGRRVRLAASSEGELAGLVDQVERWRRDFRSGALSADDVSRRITRMRIGPVTLERAAHAYMTRALAEHTRRRFRSTLATHWRELAALELGALDAPTLAAWIDKLRARGLAGSTIGVVWRALRAVARYAAERGWLSGSPWGSWRPTIGRAAPGRLPREAARSPVELGRLLAAAASLEADGPRWLGLEARVASAALLGLRQGELRGLRWSDVDAVGGAVTIARQNTKDLTKGGRLDVVAAVPELFDVLERWACVLRAATLYADDGPVFPARMVMRARIAAAGGAVRLEPHPSRREVLSTADVRAVVVRAGLPSPERWTAHSLRDSFVTLEEEGHGGDLETTRARSRHASIATLCRYLRARKRAAIAAPGFVLPPAAPAPAQLSRSELAHKH